MNILLYEYMNIQAYKRRKKIRKKREGKFPLLRFMRHTPPYNAFVAP